MEAVKRNLLALKPKDIDPNNCDHNKSITRQILQNSEKRLKDQHSQFNLGNGKTFKDPFKAADYLLEREYGDTFLFDNTHHEPISIPPVWTSEQYNKKSSTTLLDFEQLITKSAKLLVYKRAGNFRWATNRGAF